MVEKGQTPLPVANWSHFCHICLVRSKMAIDQPDFHSSSVPGCIPFSFTMSEPLCQCPDCHLCFKRLSTHSPFYAALSSDKSACSAGPSGCGLLASDGSESLDNDNSPCGDDDNSHHSKPVFPSPPRCDDLTPEHAEHIELKFDPAMESELDRLSIHSRGTKSDTDSSAESLADSVFDGMLGQHLAEHQEWHSEESEEPNLESACKKARKQELSLLTPKELVSPRALKKKHEKASNSPPPSLMQRLQALIFLAN